MITARRGFVLAAAVMLVVTAAAYLDRPFRGDESDFALMAREGILARGVPAIPPDAQRWLMPDGGTHYGMWHPPLYQYALAAVSAVTPDANWPLRAFGLLCLVASLALAWRIAGRLVPGAPRGLRAMAVSLPLLSPLVVESALFIDIDGTLLLPAILLFFERWLAWKDALTPRRVVMLGTCLALGLAVKMTTPVIALGAVGLHALAGPQRGRRFGAVVAAGLVGVLLFAAAGLAYVQLTGYRLDYMLDLYAVRGGQMSDRSLADYALSIRWNAAWIGPGLFVLIVMGLAVRAGAALRRRALEDADLLWIFAVANAAAYVGLAAYWGKYLSPAVFCALLATGLWLSRVWPALTAVRPRVVLVAAVLATGAALALPSPRARTGPPVSSLADGLRDPRTASLAAGVLVTLAMAMASRGLAARGSRLAAAGAVALSAATALSLVDQIRVVSAPADNGPLRAGVDTGFDAVVSCLNGLDGLPVVIVSKDVGYYYRGRSIHLDDPSRVAAIDRLSRRDDVGALVDHVERPAVSEAASVSSWPMVRVGSYRVYLKAPDQLPSISPTGCRSST